MGKEKTDEHCFTDPLFYILFLLLSPSLEPLWDFTMKLTGVSPPLFLSHCYCHQCLYSPTVILFFNNFLFCIGLQPVNNVVILSGEQLPCGSDGKESAHKEGNPGSIPGSGGSSGEGNGKTLQYSCLENSTDRGAWWATVHEVTKSWTQLRD